MDYTEPWITSVGWTKLVFLNGLTSTKFLGKGNTAQGNISGAFVCITNFVSNAISPFCLADILKRHPW